jgi:hypothetical protein
VNVCLSKNPLTSFGLTNQAGHKKGMRGDSILVREWINVRLKTNVADRSQV